MKLQPFLRPPRADVGQIRPLAAVADEHRLPRQHLLHVADRPPVLFVQRSRADVLRVAVDAALRQIDLPPALDRVSGGRLAVLETPPPPAPPPPRPRRTASASNRIEPSPRRPRRPHRRRTPAEPVASVCAMPMPFAEPNHPAIANNHAARQPALRVPSAPENQPGQATSAAE